MSGLAGHGKPLWARLMIKADELESLAGQLRADSLSVRCSQTDSGGARCTLDFMHAEGHRHEREDLP